jgi:hypothetical protein
MSRRCAPCSQKEIHKYALVELLGAMLAAIVPLTLGDGPLSTTEWINVGVVAAGAAVIWLAANQDEGIWAYTKMAVSTIAAGGVVLVSRRRVHLADRVDADWCGRGRRARRASGAQRCVGRTTPRRMTVFTGELTPHGLGFPGRGGVFVVMLRAWSAIPAPMLTAAFLWPHEAGSSRSHEALP